MAVLPENMDKLDVEDAPSSLAVIENYIRYMGERIEFAMRNVTKNVSAAGVSSAEIYVLVTAMNNSLSALESTVNSMNGTMNSLQGKIDTINGQITALDARVSALETTTKE